MNSKNEQMVRVPRDLLARAASYDVEMVALAGAQLRALLAQPAAQHQGEPVAYKQHPAIIGYARKSDLAPLLDRAQPAGSHISIGLDHPVCWEDESPYDHLVALYAHPDAGEVERLRETVRYFEAAHEDSRQHVIKIEAERDTLRAQLAERDALLRDLVSMDIPRTAAAIERAKQILSASAEPNQCDGCQAGIPLINGAHRMGKPGGYADTMSCQAGKYAIAESSAPVERDEREAFQREGRYIVIKLVDLAKVPSAVGEPFAEQLTAIQRRLPSRQYVVVESDWPEYEPTWAAIQARAALESKP